MKRSVRLRLTEMLDAIEGIEATVGEATFAAYEKNSPMRRAVERGIEIISEGSRHLPEELKATHLQPRFGRSVNSYPPTSAVKLAR